jgi:hypothetical protein
VRAAAAHPGSIDLQPESVEASVGVPVTLRVRVYDASGALYAGEGTSTFVRMVFLQGSANDPGAAQSFHLSCRTESAGRCSVTYTPLRTGRDLICARISGGPATCDEPVGASEQDDPIDVVRVNVHPSLAPTPSAAPTSSPAPTKATPAPTRSPKPPKVTPRPTSEAPAPSTATPRPHKTAAPSPAGPDEPAPTSSPVLVAGGSGPGPSATPGGAVAGTGSKGSGASPAPREADGFGAAASFAGSLIKPDAAAAVATTFGFPIALMVAVVLFLLLQPRLDDRDPKLRQAPRAHSELLLPFEREIDL